MRILNLWVVREQARGRVRGDLHSEDITPQFINALVAGSQLQALAVLISEPIEAAEISQFMEINVRNFFGG